MLIEGEVRPNRSSTIHEHGDGITLGQRRYLELALGGDPQHATTRDQQTQVLTAGEELGQVRRDGEDVLEVVEQQQHALLVDVLGDPVGCPQGPPDRRQNERWFAEGRKRNPEDPIDEVVDELSRNLERQARLAAAAGAGQGEQADILASHEFDRPRHLAAPADQRSRLGGQVRRIERAKRREVGSSQLVEALRLAQVLESVATEVAHRTIHLGKRKRLLGEDDLAAVRGGADPRRAVNVDPSVALLDLHRLTAVKPHSHADGPVAERRLSAACSLDRIGCRSERNEE